MLASLVGVTTSSLTFVNSTCLNNTLSSIGTPLASQSAILSSGGSANGGGCVNIYSNADITNIQLVNSLFSNNLADNLSNGVTCPLNSACAVQAGVALAGSGSGGGALYFSTTGVLNVQIAGSTFVNNALSNSCNGGSNTAGNGA